MIKTWNEKFSELFFHPKNGHHLCTLVSLKWLLPLCNTKEDIMTSLSGLCTYDGRQGGWYCLVMCFKTVTWGWVNEIIFDKCNKWRLTHARHTHLFLCNDITNWSNMIVDTWHLQRKIVNERHIVRLQKCHHWPLKLNCAGFLNMFLLLFDLDFHWSPNKVLYQNNAVD